MDALKDLVAGGCAPDGQAVAGGPMGRLGEALGGAYPAGAVLARSHSAESAVYEMDGSAGHHPDLFRAHSAMSAGSGGPGGVVMPRGAEGMMGGGSGLEAAWTSGGVAAAPVSGPEAAHGHARVHGLAHGHAHPAMGHMGMFGPMGHMGGMMGPMSPMAMGPGQMHMAPPQPPAVTMAATAAPVETTVAASAADATEISVSNDTRNDMERPEELTEGDRLEAEYARTLAESLASAETDDAGARTRATSRALAEHLSEHPDPRFAESELIKFLSRVGDGSLAIEPEQNTVRETGTVLEPAATQVAPAQETPATEAQQEEARFQEMWQRAVSGEEVDMTSFWQQAFSGEDGGRFMENMASGFDGVDDEAKLEEAWAAAAAREAEEAQEYKLTEENPFADETDPFARGKQLFEEGRLKEAVLAFEAVVAKEEDHSEGWRMLGVCHAENDEDRKAITCLEKAVDVDPYNLEALVGLGVSYVNEQDHAKALANLQAWVKHNPKFAGLKFEADHYSDGTLMDEVMQLMLKAQDWDPSDPEVKIVLGVLYNVSRDFDSAIEAFRLALDHKPDDYSLWNKLGATRANSRRSKEALPAYRRALELKPTYARGWLNLGISHANLGDYAAAAKAYLHALQLNPSATHIWSYVRIAFTCMERFDLVEMAELQDASKFQAFLST